MRRALVAAVALTLAVPFGLARADESPARGAGTGAQVSDDPAQYVDPFIGTLGGGFTFPGAAAPYGMVQNSPDTEGQFAYTGYQYADGFIRGFSLVHLESMGVKEGGNLPIMATTGAVVTDVKQYQSPFSHASEQASPGYYRVLLARDRIDAELTAGTRVAMQRYTFPASTQANVLFDVGRQIPGGATDDVQSTPGTNPASVHVVDARTVVGTSNTNLSAAQGYSVHFAARFDRDATGFGVWSKRGAAPQAGVSTVTGNGAGAYLTFDSSSVPVVRAKIGISFVSEDGALANLAAELPGEDFDFDALRARTRAAWNDALHAIEVSGGSDGERTSFTTALYHAQHHPNVFNDADGRYLGHDGIAHRIGAAGDPMPAGSTYYANFSLWDTYRAEMPLLELIAPDRVRDMMRTLNAIAVQGGRLPRWSLNNRYPDYMIAEPALQTIGDAFCRGLVPADVRDSLYAQARALAFSSLRNDGPDFRAGYVPLEHSSVATSTTLEYASAHFALALMANATGNTADRDRALGYAAGWRNVFDPDTRFARPRSSSGTYVANYHPELPDGFKEGTGWQWTWLVPHDIRGLVNAMGAAPQAGDAFVQQRLDTFFSTPVASTVPVIPGEAQQKITAFGIAYYGNQYAPSNEHDLEAPFLYNWVGQPWKSQALARQHQALFRPTPDGMPGNDDLGTMSAWFVWSALGLYPEIPGSPLYTVGSPMFARAVIRLPGGTAFTIDAPGTSVVNKYVQSGSLNGADLNATYVRHPAITTPGGSLRLDMGATANEAWASGRSAAPPSMSDSPLASFGCAP